MAPATAANRFFQKETTPMAKISIAIKPASTKMIPPIFPQECAIPAPMGAAIISINHPIAKPAATKKTKAPVSTKPKRKKTATKVKKSPVKQAAPKSPPKIAAKTKSTGPKITSPKITTPTIHLPDYSQNFGLTSDAPPEKPAIPLPQSLERLVASDQIPAPTSSYSTQPSAIPPLAKIQPAIPRPYADTVLPKKQSLTRPNNGLIAAIGHWLRSSKLLVKLGLVKQKRTLPKPPNRLASLQPAPQNHTATSTREQTEMTQLRAENRRLRSQIEALIALEETRSAREKI
jgi:hypothetical protein